MGESRAGGQRFAAAVRRHRREAGLTQGELAERAGLAELTVRNTEAGKSTPQRPNFLALAAAFGLSPEGTPAEYASFEAAWRAQRASGVGAGTAPHDSPDGPLAPDADGPTGAERPPTSRPIAPRLAVAVVA